MVAVEEAHEMGHGTGTWAWGDVHPYVCVAGGFCVFKVISGSGTVGDLFPFASLSFCIMNITFVIRKVVRTPS